MKALLVTLAVSLSIMNSSLGHAAVSIQLTDDDFGITNTFNNIIIFEIDIELADSIVPGGTYVNPAIDQIDYRIFGQLPNATPSDFDAFNLLRGYSGADFYAQSPESGLSFSVRADAVLTDGLQLSELVGTGSDPILTFNARELNQNPGRYHPPDLVLRADGTGRLQNANNMSTFPNPPLPFGSGLIVDVDFGEEYIADLTFTPSAVTIAVPEPGSFGLLALIAYGFGIKRNIQRPN
ncbi:MAG: hypothetical protein AAF664_07425 [Planctomycetota bacterium]